MTGDAKGLHLDDWGKIILGDVSDSQRIFPTEVEFAGTSAQLVTLRAAPAATLFDFGCDFTPIAWV